MSRCYHQVILSIKNIKFVWIQKNLYGFLHVKCVDGMSQYNPAQPGHIDVDITVRAGYFGNGDLCLYPYGFFRGWLEEEVVGAEGDRVVCIRQLGEFANYGYFNMALKQDTVVQFGYR